MINIKRNHILCKKHGISHSKKANCRKCKLDIINYDNSTRYMKKKVLKKLNKKYQKTQKMK